MHTITKYYNNYNNCDSTTAFIPNTILETEKEREKNNIITFWNISRKFCDKRFQKNIIKNCFDNEYTKKTINILKIFLQIILPIYYINDFNDKFIYTMMIMI